MKRIQYNAPVILSFALMSGFALLLGFVTGGLTNELLFSVYRSSFTEPLSYLRVFLHVLGHADFSHYVSNMLMILILGPMVEERYGSQNTAFMILVTALATGVLHSLLSPHTALLGASGIVFMLIFLSSLAGMKGKQIPLTLILVAILYFGQEIYAGLFHPDQISQLTHIAGGLCGIVLGLILRRGKRS